MDSVEIRYLRDGERERSRLLYEDVFVEDLGGFSEAYYRVKARDNQILVAEDDGKIVSMLHRNPYTLWFRGKSVPADYIVAVATRVTYRHRGLMRSLLYRALQDMYAEGHPFTFLMPEDEAIYTPFDFRLLGNDDEAGLADLTEEELKENYEIFVEKDAAYQRRNVVWPGWESTPMMARLVDLAGFAEVIGAEEPRELVLRIADPILSGNDGIFSWSFTAQGSTLKRSEAEPELAISIADLGSFLFGMLGAEELPGITEQTLQKLEQVHVLNGIYINERV